MNIKYLRAADKFFMLIYIKLSIIFKYIDLVFKKKMTFKEYRLFIKRVFHFLNFLKENKFIKIDKKVKIDLNIPLFGSDAFYNYLERFKITEGKLPCSNVLLSVTRECSFECKHCYQREDRGEDVKLETLLDVTKVLMDQGVALFKIEGGDPFIKFDRLKAVCEEIGHSGEITINTTGNGVNLERLKYLNQRCNIGSIMFSLNSPNEEDVNFFMGQDYAWNAITHGLRLCNISSIPTGLNCCLQRDDFFNGNFEYLLSRAIEYGVSFINILHPKSAGAWIEGGYRQFTKEDLDHIKYIVNKFNKKRVHRRYPSIYAQIIEEDEDHHGCAAGGTNRFYINAKGDVQPCEYLNISFGNIERENFKDIYSRMRDLFETPGINWLCQLNSPKISSLFKKGDSLPLDEDKSKLIYNIWDKGDYTPLYKKLEKELI